jgi:tRNA pseudouridine55 synthase
MTTATGDREGEVTGTCAVEIDRAQIEAVLPRFRGAIAQTPPMYSALKHEGRPLYAYAREGLDIAREARAVTIESLEVDDYTAPDLTIRVKCSKGTYIRVLAEDIGAALRCGACLAGLRRTDVDRFTVANAIPLETLAAMTEAQREGCLLPVDAMLTALPSVVLNAAESARIEQGRAVERAVGEHGLVRLYGPERRFLGVADAAHHVLQPRRLVGQKSR